MTAKSITVHDNQNIYDIAMQHLGNADYAVDIALANNLTTTSTLTKGQQIILPEPSLTRQDKDIKSKFTGNAATGTYENLDKATYTYNPEIVRFKGQKKRTLFEKNIYDGQTLFDYALQHTGSADNATAIARANALGITSILTKGQRLTIPASIVISKEKQRLISSLRDIKKIVATGAFEEADVFTGDFDETDFNSNDFLT